MGTRLNQAGAHAQAKAKAAAGSGGGGGGVGGEGGVGGGAGGGGYLGTVVDAFKAEYRLAMMDPGDAAAERRKQQPGYIAPGPVDVYEGTTAMAVSRAPRSRLRAGWDTFAEKTGFTTVFSKLQGLKRTPVYKKGEEALEDMRERWETSDNPMVHRIQDMQENLWSETEQAEAYRVIRQRQPEFNINGFLAEVRRDVPKVLAAYLKGDAAALAGTNISKEMLERMGGQMKLWQHEGQFVDPRVLHLSDLELVEVH
jgi:import inner membrane translocase subunit TIM44